MQVFSKLLILMLVAGCASLRPNNFDHEKSKTIKKVAILGLTVQQSAPTDNLKLSAITNKNVSAQDSEELKQMSNSIYEKLANRINKQTGWKLMDRSAVTGNAAYQALYKDKMGAVRRTDFSQGDVLWPANTVDWFNISSLNHEERVALAKKMGADGYAVVRINQSIDQGFGIGNIMGKADFVYSSEILMEIYSNTSPDPVWKLITSGDPSRNSSELSKDMSVYKKRAVIGLESAENLFNKLAIKK